MHISRVSITRSTIVLVQVQYKAEVGGGRDLTYGDDDEEYDEDDYDDDDDMYGYESDTSKAPTTKDTTQVNHVAAVKESEK